MYPEGIMKGWAAYSDDCRGNPVAAAVALWVQQEPAASEWRCLSHKVSIVTGAHSLRLNREWAWFTLTCEPDHIRCWASTARAEMIILPVADPAALRQLLQWLQQQYDSIDPQLMITPQDWCHSL